MGKCWLVLQLLFFNFVSLHPDFDEVVGETRSVLIILFLGGRGFLTGA